MKRRIFTVTFEEFAKKLGYNNFEKVNGWYVHQVLNEALVFLGRRRTTRFAPS